LESFSPGEKHFKCAANDRLIFISAGGLLRKDTSSEGMVACNLGLLSLLPAADASSERTGTLRVSARRAGDPFSITPTSEEF